MVCQRMLKEREEQLRGEYDKLLAAKLAGVVFKIIIMYACIKLQALFYSLYSSMTSWDVYQIIILVDTRQLLLPST